MGDFTNDPEPPPRLRWVTHLSISDDAADREARLTDESPRPHVTLDFADAPLANETRFEPGTFAPIFASVGDVGAGRADAEPGGRLSDFNGDGLDDIWIGSESFNGLIGQFKAGAGRVHLIPGRQRSVSFQGDGSLPGDGDFEVLVNRGDRLIDPQTGQPVVFVPPALRVGEQDRWFRFTTAGDGAAGDQIRIVSLPGPDVPETPVDALPRPTVRIDLISDDGRVLATNQTIVDLRNRTAESYWIRVHRDSANPTTAGLPFRLEIAPPSLGDSHRPSDRDRLFGGPGDDRLSGDAELDVLRGGSGSDLFLSEREERFDFENGIDRVDPGFNRPEEANHQRLGQPADSPIDIAAHFDRALWRPIAEAMGQPVTTNADSRSVLHRAWFASGLAQIETLDLSGIPATDLSGLTLMTNLRHLDLRSSLRTAIDLPVLPKLQQLILSGNPIERVSASELSTLPQLRTLVLDNTSLADLGGLVGVQIVDDRDGGYVEGGSWQSEASATADAWLDGYRFTKSGGSATWTVAAPAGEVIRLWATWPTLENESTTATTYQVFDGESLLATVPVFQSTPAGALDENAMFGGRPWESLGEFASTSGDLSIVLAGADGTVVAADAVRAEQVSSPALSLETISLLGSPLNDVSRDQLLGRLQATNPLEVVLTADPGYQVALHGFDLGGWQQNRQITFLEVLNEADTRDGGERGVGGIVVHLLNALGEVSLCTVTDVHGNYRLQGGPAFENHTVQVMLPSAWRSTGSDSASVTSLESTVDFGVAKPLDIGADRGGVEGRLQSFELTSSLALGDIAWEVRQGANVVATGNSASLPFTPTKQGSYLVSVTARDTVSDVVYDDELWLHVSNGPPLVVILADGVPTAELTVHQGSGVALTSVVTDPGRG